MDPVIPVKPDNRKFKPAAGRHFLTALYDPVMAVTMREKLWRADVVAQVTALHPASVLEVGSGTGSLTVALEKGLDAPIIGLDPDPDALRRATEKATVAGSEIEFVEGSADELPFEDGSFDAVVSTLVFHHLKPAQKKSAATEMRRVVRPGGAIIVADWGPPRNLFESAGFFLVQLLDGFETTVDHRHRSVTELFGTGTIDRRYATVWGCLELAVVVEPSVGALTPSPTT